MSDLRDHLEELGSLAKLQGKVGGVFAADLKAVHHIRMIPVIGALTYGPDVQAEVMFNCLQSEQVVGIQRHDLACICSGFSEIYKSCRNFVADVLEGINAAKNLYSSVIAQLTVAIAATGCLGQRIEAAFGAKDDRKAHVHACFDQLSRDQRHRPFAS